MVYGQTFDRENRLADILVGVQLTRFTYDAAGQRVKTVEPDGDIIHYPFPFYEVKNPGQANEEIRKTYFLGGQVIALCVEADLYYFFTDHLGSTTRLSDSSGSAVLGSEASYLPFGGYRVTPTAGITDRGFTGHAHNDALGLVYMKARFYVVGIGRFASADTIVPDPKNPQSFNRYTYVLNSPLRYADPTGHAYAISECRECVGKSGGEVPLVVLFIYKQMIGNGSSDVATQLQDLNISCRSCGVLLDAGGQSAAAMADLGDKAIANLSFASKVRQGGEWDPKPRIEQEFAELQSDPYYYQLWEGGPEYYYDVWGNIMYGYLGAASGFSESSLLDGAGLEQIGSSLGYTIDNIQN